MLNWFTATLLLYLFVSRIQNCDYVSHNVNADKTRAFFIIIGKRTRKLPNERNASDPFRSHATKWRGGGSISPSGSKRNTTPNSALVLPPADE